MAFEYSSQNRGISFPNPLKVHNRFLVGAAIVLAGFATAILFSIREHLAAGQRSFALPAMTIALVLLAPGVRYLYDCLSNLRFYFGIGRPRGLTGELTPDTQGVTPFAEFVLKEPLRQQAIKYREPNGPITGLLYSLVPNLIYAPNPLRRFAEWQFKGGVTLVALLVGLTSTLVIGVPDQKVSSSSVPNLIGAIFLLVTVWVLIRWNPTSTASSADSGFLSIGRVSTLIAFAIVGPIVLSILVTNLPFQLPFKPFPHVFFFIVGGIAVHLVFFASIVKQLMPPPPTTVSVIQETWNLSTNPALITGEFLRAMQESWREKIPNRHYSRIEPAINLNVSSGPFRGEIIEETQPFPRLVNPESQEQISPSGSRSLILALDLVGLAFTFGTGVTAFLVCRGLLDDGRLNTITSLYAVFCWSLGFYALSVARWLLLRFDFISQLFWLDLNGQYVSARVDQGNVLQGSLRASSSIVKVEGMTFRLWAAQIHTVTFGKDAERQIVSMAGIPDIVEGLTSRLKNFMDSQATVVALGNAANAERLAANNRLANRSGNTGAISTGRATIAALGDAHQGPFEPL